MTPGDILNAIRQSVESLDAVSARDDFKDPKELAKARRARERLLQAARIVAGMQSIDDEES